MKKLLALILSILMLFSLTACENDTEHGDTIGSISGEENDKTDPSNEETKPPIRTQKLVSTYNCKGIGNLAFMWEEFIFTFSYNEGFSGGTVNLSGPENDTISGEFTCDENHRITGITITEDETTMHIEVKYDEQDRVTFSKITLQEDGEEELFLHTENAYDENGNTIYSYIHNPRFGQININENVYNADGLLLETVQQTKVGENDIYTKTSYTYHGSAIASITVSDKDGNVQGTLSFQPETVDGVTSYVAAMDNQTLRYCYDENGNITLTEITLGDTVISRNESTYNEKGQLVKTQTTSSAGTIVYEYTYDEDGTRTGTKALRDGEEIGWLYISHITITP